MALTKSERAERKAERAAAAERIARAQAETRAIVATGKCPRCGAGIHQNLSILGWWQCDRSGSATFRRDPSGEPCSWQGFTE
jgi:hypothetical protein